MRRAYVDANVILRFITNDPPEMAEKAGELFASADAGDVELTVDSTIIAEVVWVLQSFYGFTPAEIAPILQAFLVSDSIASEEKVQLAQALVLYEEKNVDFVDALLAVRMTAHGITDVYSFDRHFDRFESIHRLSPGGD